MKRILIITGVVIVLLAAFWWMQNRVEIATGKVAEAATTLKQIQAQNAHQFEAMRQQIVAIERERAELEAANSLLARRVADREQVVKLKEQQLQERKTLVMTSPLLDVAARWAELAEVPPQSIRPAPDDDLLVAGLTARKTVSLLEELPVVRDEVMALEQDKTDLRQQIANEMRVSTGWEQQCRLCNEKQTLLDSEHKAALELSRQQLGLEKARARRSKLRWAVGGGIVGLVVGLVAK